MVILDVNDNPPTFERTSYYASISEAATVGTEVVRVWATSLDIGANAAITYSIAAGNQQGKFSIGADNGRAWLFYGKLFKLTFHSGSRGVFLRTLTTLVFAFIYACVHTK